MGGRATVIDDKKVRWYGCTREHRFGNRARAAWGVMKGLKSTLHSLNAKHKNTVELAEEPDC